MRSPVEKGLRFGLFLASLSAVLPLAATVTFQSPVPNLGKSEQQIFVRPLSEFGHSSDPVVTADTAVPPPIAFDTRYLPEYAISVVNSAQEADSEEIVRHRGFVKALLIILLAGGLIRLLTSSSYQKFISDVLDPKTF